nr:MAG TPA: hypothetical protein [Caudoviricetes sp.]
MRTLCDDKAGNVLTTVLGRTRHNLNLVELVTELLEHIHSGLEIPDKGCRVSGVALATVRSDRQNLDHLTLVVLFLVQCPRLERDGLTLDINQLVAVRCLGEVVEVERGLDRSGLCNDIHDVAPLLFMNVWQVKDLLLVSGLLLALTKAGRFLSSDVSFLDNVSVVEPLGGGHAVGLDLAGHTGNSNRLELVILPNLDNSLETGRRIRESTVQSDSHIHDLESVGVHGLDAGSGNDRATSDSILTHNSCLLF